MKRENIEELIASNVLFKIYHHLQALPLNFGKRVCIECNCSMPTFYRKVKFLGERSSGGIIKQAYSNAEKDMYIQILDDELTNCRKSFEDDGLRKQ